MGRLEERDLRSLERRSMYSIFAPLEGDDGLSRELALEDRAAPTRAGELAVWGFIRRRMRRSRRVAAAGRAPATRMFLRRLSQLLRNIRALLPLLHAAADSHPR